MYRGATTKWKGLIRVPDKKFFNDKRKAIGYQLIK